LRTWITTGSARTQIHHSDQLEPSPKVAWKAMQEGRDVRAITAMLDRTFGEESAHVAEPHTFDELAKLSREQRRALITQLEREGRGSPFRMPEH
jgi:hypothetical protein